MKLTISGCRASVPTSPMPAAMTSSRATSAKDNIIGIKPSLPYQVYSGQRTVASAIFRRTATSRTV